MKILVVDDEKIKRITLADDLATQGHEVVTAADGEEALEKLAAGRFDVVVTDLKMPTARRHRTAEADQAGSAVRSDRGHHDDRLRQHSRGRRGGEARGVRLPDQAVPQRRRVSAAGADRTATEAAADAVAPAASLGGRRPRGHDRRPIGRHGPRETDGRNLRQDRRQRACCTARRAWARTCWPPRSIAIRTATGFPTSRSAARSFRRN